jgi:hypothetical protein
VAYRDDTEALLAKIASLEEANAELEREIERLRRDPALGGEPSPLERVLGSRLVLRAERTIEGELDERERMRIAEMIGGALGRLGRPLFVGRSIVLRGGGDRDCRPSIHVTITSRDGKTTIRILERRGGLAGGLAGGAIGAAASGVGPAVGLVPYFGPGALIAVPLGIGTALFGFRALFSALGRRRARELDALAASAAKSAEDVVPRAAAPQVRVAPESDVDGAPDAEARSKRVETV